MKRALLEFGIAVAVLAFVLVGASRRAEAATACEVEPNPTPDGVEFVPCELLVKLDSAVDPLFVIASAGAEPVQHFTDLLVPGPVPGEPLSPGDVPPAVLDAADAYLVRVVDPGLTAQDVIDNLVASGHAVFVHRNVPTAPATLQPVPNDPLYPRKWDLLNVGQTGVGTIDADIDAPQGWQLHTAALGPGVVDCRSLIVAVMDTGVDFSHPDLAANAWIGAGGVSGYNTIPVPPTNNVTDNVGHGTFVAGVIGAQGNNLLDVTGVCWRAQIMALKALDVAGGSVASAVAAMQIAIAHNVVAAIFGGPRIRVVNMSFIFGANNVPYGVPAGTTLALSQQIAAADAVNILVVAAAGNDAQNVDGLAAGRVATPCQAGKELGGGPLPNELCIAASTDADVFAGFTNFGNVSVDVAAPGQRVHSLSATFDSQMNVYRHGGAGDLVVAGDTRLRGNGAGAGIPTPAVTYAAGSAVAAADADVGSRLEAINAQVKHRDNVAVNGVYDPGEFVYRDVDLNGLVSAGDHRYLPPFPFPCPGPPPGCNALVAGGDPDVGFPLVPFTGTERKTSTNWQNGTSFSAPEVSGTAALCLSAPGFDGVDDRTMKNLVDRFHDRKQGVRNVAGNPATITGGRLRWPCTADFGDLRQQPGLHDACGYHTVQRDPLTRLGNPQLPAVQCDGPVHRDTTVEWLGRKVSNEHNADTPPPQDEDPTANVTPRPDRDGADDGFVDFVFGGAPGVITGVKTQVCSDAFGLRDAAGGRYGAAANRLLYLNGYFDWDSDGDFDLPGEHNLHASIDPTIPFPLPAPGGPPNPVPPATNCIDVTSPLQIPAPRPGFPGAWRLRLDWGEDVAGNLPLGYWTGDARPANNQRDFALFGEVEDYVFGNPYLCYGVLDLNRPLPTFGVFNLTDQFYEAAYRPTRAERLCTPASKNAEGVLDPITHLKAYKLKKVSGDHLQPIVDVRDQFGTLRLHVIRETDLLVPTAKDLVMPPPPPDDALPGFEHYKCYRVSTVGTKLPRGIRVEMADQFGVGKYELRRPGELCVPVAKKPVGGPLEPVRNPLRHLMCYWAKTIEPTNPPPAVFTTNQLGTEHLRIRGEKLICVPALKTVVP